MMLKVSLVSCERICRLAIIAGSYDCHGRDLLHGCISFQLTLSDEVDSSDICKSLLSTLLNALTTSVQWAFATSLFCHFFAGFGICNVCKRLASSAWRVKHTSSHLGLVCELILVHLLLLFLRCLQRFGLTACDELSVDLLMRHT